MDFDNMTPEKLFAEMLANDPEDQYLPGIDQLCTFGEIDIPIGTICQTGSNGVPAVSYASHRKFRDKRNQRCKVVSPDILGFGDEQPLDEVHIGVVFAEDAVPSIVPKSDIFKLNPSTL